MDFLDIYEFILFWQTKIKCPVPDIACLSLDNNDDLRDKNKKFRMVKKNDFKLMGKRLKSE